MLVLLMLGCLTPESFSEAYAERLCDEYAACGVEVEDCVAAYERGLTSEICPDWSADAAAECLSAEPWCDEPEMNVDGTMGSGVTIPEACGGALLGCP